VGIVDASVLELIDELENLKQSLFSRFDQYLKLQVQKRGITVVQNTYTGFDTEYESLNPVKNLNKLISVQTAIQRRTIVKVPLYNPYDISYVHPLTSEISNVFNGKVDLVDYPKYEFVCGGRPIKNDRTLTYNELKLINYSLKHAISNIRKCLFHSIDEVNFSIINSFKKVEGVEYFEDFKRDQIIFILPLTPISKQIAYPVKGFSIDDLLEMCHEKIDKKDFSHSFSGENNFSHMISGDVDLTSSHLIVDDCIINHITGNFETVSSSPLNILNSNSLQTYGSLPIKSTLSNVFKGGSSTASSNASFLFPPSQPAQQAQAAQQAQPAHPAFGNNLREDFVALIKLFTTLNLNFNFNLKTTPLKMIEWFDNATHKPRTRTRLFFNNGAEISLSIVKNNFILAHYTPADLSMLDGFEALQTKLSIVNKSYVTLGTPLKLSNTNVHIRDTKLLAPAGMGSLESLGKLYEKEGDYNKKTISTEDINKMSNFLKRDQKAFEEYALQDAVITLKHGLAMEKFNFSIKQYGIPLTLSSVGRKYVFDE
jgi:hypothetical protein